jgi:hypothetical protein
MSIEAVRTVRCHTGKRLHENCAIQFEYHWRTTDRLLNLVAGVHRVLQHLVLPTV